jgi:hypothetical protein
MSGLKPGARFGFAWKPFGLKKRAARDSDSFRTNSMAA